MQEPTNARLEEAERRAGGMAVGVLTIIGIWLLVAPLIESFSGYAWMRRTLGGDGGIARFFLGFLFLYFGGVVRDKNQMRRTLNGFMKIIKKQIQGSDPEQDRAAIDILLKAMASDKEDVRSNAHAALCRLTGHDLGPVAAPWEDWWRGARKDFVRQDVGGGAAAPGTPGEA